MRRPSCYVLVCALVLLVTFSASGHLRFVERPTRGNADRAETSRPTAVARPTPTATTPPRLETQVIEGSVQDAMGFLLVGAEVQAGEQRVQTDADGRFQVAVAARGATDLLVRSTGCRPGWVRAWPSSREVVWAMLDPAVPWDRAEPAPEPVSTALHGEGFVRATDGRPVAGALVIVAETGARARTDEVGRYEVVLPPSPVRLIVHQPEGGEDGRGLAFRSEPFTAPRTQGRVLLPELAVAPANVLRGTIRDDAGQPQRGVPLQVVGEGFARTIASGEGGAFRLGGLLPGEYELRLLPFRGALGEQRTIQLDQPVADCELHLRRAAERRLRVVGETGEPVPRAVVAASIGGRRRVVGRADDDGWVDVAAADRAASYEVGMAGHEQALRVLEPARNDDRLVVALP